MFCRLHSVSSGQLHYIVSGFLLQDTFSVIMGVVAVFIINLLTQFPILNRIYSHIQLASKIYSMRTKYLLSASIEKLFV